MRVKAVTAKHAAAPTPIVRLKAALRPNPDVRRVGRDNHILLQLLPVTLLPFAGAALLARFYPRAAWVAYALAFGCAATRVLAQAHFVSDAVAGAIAGWAVGTWLGRGIPAPTIRASA